MFIALCLIALSGGQTGNLERTESTSANGALRLIVDPTSRRGAGEDSSGGGSRIVAVVPALDGESIAVFESNSNGVRRFAWP